MPKIKYKKKKQVITPVVKKEFNINNYKIIDDGYDIIIHIKVQDGFGNEYYRHYGTFLHTPRQPTGTKARARGGLFGFNDDQIHDLGFIIKHLLDENAHLKFYNKLEKALE